jgi:hypothetical protein
MSLVTVLMFVIFFACVAMCYAEGFWSNAIRLINVVTAALLAVNFYEPVARWLDEQQPSYTYLWDFLSLWAVFCIFLVIFRLLTDKLSHVKVRFMKIVDRIGSGILTAWIGWVMICFVMMTLHTAPLSCNFLRGDFLTGTDERMVLGFAPDRQWLAFTQRMSSGVFSRSEEGHVFDPNADFMPKYATRRTELEKQLNTSHALRTP